MPEQLKPKPPAEKLTPRPPEYKFPWFMIFYWGMVLFSLTFYNGF